MMQNLYIMGLWLSGIAFALFVISLLLQLFRAKPPQARVSVGAGNTQQEGLGPEEFAKLFEALAKLADSLNHAGPVVISLIASIIFFILAMLAAMPSVKSSGDSDHKDKKDDKVALSMLTEACVLYPFDPGEHQLIKAGLNQLKQDPKQCAQRLLEQVEKGAISMVLLVGHADRRSLSGRKIRYYGTNETLAYQRALEVKRVLLAAYTPKTAEQLKIDEFARRMVVVEGGPVYVDRGSVEEQLAQDRSVEVFLFGIDGTPSGVVPQ
jgi:hypothetical protein